MADGRSRDEWGRMSSLMALLANCHRDPKKGRASKPDDFSPYKSKKSQPIQASVSVLRDVFVPKAKS